MMPNWSDSSKERSLQDRSYDLLGEMILEEEAKALMAELEEERASGKSAETDAFFVKNDKRFAQVIDKACRKEEGVRLRRLVPGFSQIAALVILSVFLLGTVAVATSEGLRKKVMQIYMHVTQEFTELEMAPPGNYVFPPDEWQGKYYLSWIPEGLELAQALEKSVTYWHDGDISVSLFYHESGFNFNMRIDTEDAVVESTFIQDQLGYVVTKGDSIMIYWANDERFFLVGTRGFDRETALFAANHIFPLDQKK